MMDYTVKLYVGSQEYSSSNAPDKETAERVAKWHIDKGSINRAEVTNAATGNVERFGSESGEAMNLETGEFIERCPGCRDRDSQIASLERALRSERAAHSRTKREKEDEMEASEDYEDVVFLFNFWRRVCCHSKSKLDLARYRDVLPFLKAEGVEMCARAIAGAAFDSMSNVRKSGAPVVYNDWELIFRNRTKSESFCNRAPKNWKEMYQYQEQVPA